MRHILRLIVLLTTGVGMGAPVAALDLSGAYQAALIQDATLQSAKSATEAVREVLPQARAQMFPSINASFSRNNNNLLSRSPNFFGQVTESTNGYPSRNDTLSLRQPLYRKVVWTQYQLAQTQLTDSEATLELETQNLAVRVSAAYFEALLANDHLSLVRSQLAAIRVHLDAAQKMLQAGSGIRTDVDEAQANLDLSLAQELEALQNVDYTRQKLRVMVNRSFDVLAVLQASALPLNMPHASELESWLTKAEKFSPEIKSLRARVESAELEIEKANAGHYPSLDLVAQWSRSSSENTVNINTSYEQHSVGLQLNIPLYAGGGVNAAARQAGANLERAQHNLDAAQRELGVRVHKEFRGVTEGILRIKALQTALVSAIQVLESSRRSFQAGSRTRLDVLNAETKKVSVLQDLAQARYLYLLSQLRLTALVGEADAQAIGTINQYLAEGS